MEESRPAAAASRTAHILHIAPCEPTRLARLVLPSTGPASDPASLRTLVLTSDAETAAATAAAGGFDEAHGPAIVALTSVDRAARVLRARVPAVAAVPVAVAAGLIAKSALPIATLRYVIVAMPDAPENASLRDALDTVMAELPRDTVRTLLAGRESPEVEELVTRHFFKARRTREAGEPPRAQPGFAIQTLSATAASRWDTLRRLLDELDPPSAVIITTDDTRASAERTLALMGYTGNESVRVVSEEIPAGAPLAVFVTVPDAISLGRALAASPTRMIVLCAPREITALRAVAGLIAVSALALDGPRARADSAERTIRGRLREILASGAYARELLALTPLMDEFDASEIAAAALVYADEARRPATAVTPAAAPEPARPSAPRFERRPPGDGERRPREREPREREPRGESRERGPREGGRFPRGTSRPREGGRPPREGGRPPRGGDRPPPRPRGRSDRER